MRNLKLCEKILGTAEAHPDLFDMDHWARRELCGTPACLSGHAMLESGYALHFQRGEPLFTRPDGSLVTDMVEEGITLMGLTVAEYEGSTEDEELFFLDNEPAIARFREIIGAERARRWARQEKGEHRHG